MHAAFRAKPGIAKCATTRNGTTIGARTDRFLHRFKMKSATATVSSITTLVRETVTTDPTTSSTTATHHTRPARRYTPRGTSTTRSAPRAIGCSANLSHGLHTALQIAYLASGVTNSRNRCKSSRRPAMRDSMIARQPRRSHRGPGSADDVDGIHVSRHAPDEVHEKDEGDSKNMNDLIPRLWYVKKRWGLGLADVMTASR